MDAPPRGPDTTPLDAPYALLPRRRRRLRCPTLRLLPPPAAGRSAASTNCPRRRDAEGTRCTESSPPAVSRHPQGPGEATIKLTEKLMAGRSKPVTSGPVGGVSPTRGTKAQNGWRVREAVVRNPSSSCLLRGRCGRGEEIERSTRKRPAVPEAAETSDCSMY
jgi:hypothetical protein